MEDERRMHHRAQDERTNPLQAKSAQQWFNQLPDDTAKSIVNMRWVGRAQGTCACVQRAWI